MVIYGEYLFIENFIAGLLLILLTGKLTGRMPAKMRILLARRFMRTERLHNISSFKRRLVSGSQAFSRYAVRGRGLWAEGDR